MYSACNCPQVPYNVPQPYQVQVDVPVEQIVPVERIVEVPQMIQRQIPVPRPYLAGTQQVRDNHCNS